MSDAEELPKKKSKLPLFLGLAGALALGGGGFYATWSGMILGNQEHEAQPHAPLAAEAAAIPDVAFVPIDPIVISLGRAAAARHLRFASQLEVGQQYQEDVAKLQPRIVDVMNSYLRAVEITQLEDPTALVRIKAQMLRRVQIVTGEGRVRDLLISEFILN